MNQTLAPLCRYCGGPIRKRVRTVYIEKEPTPYHSTSEFSRYVYGVARTKADCARMTNWAVTSISRTDDKELVRSFGEWDGESYVDRFFCTGDHARLFGYLMAHAGRSTTAYAEALRRREDEAKP